MEFNLDSEDMATFYRSLLLLHSPKIDSQRKLYHIMNQSIRKHHPTRKIPYGKKSSEIPGAEASTLKMHVGDKETDQTSDNEAVASQRDRGVKKEQDSVKPSVSSSRDSRPKVDPGNTGTKPDSKSCESKAVPQSLASSSTSFVNCLGVKSSSSSQPSDISPKKLRVSHLAGRDSPFSKPMPKASTKTSGKHYYCPNPVNLKKIRAVLARGDPFPTHLTKACINNITPDLQREKL